MLFCLNSRCSSKYLRQADQIKIKYRDRNSLPTVAENYPDKTIILEYDGELAEKDYDLIKRYPQVILSVVRHSAHKDLPYFMRYPVSSFSEALGFKQNGAKYIYPGPGLFFRQDDFKLLNMPARYIVNHSWLTTINPSNNICGQYIRPEALQYYDNCTETVAEFMDITPSAEEALFRIYAEKKSFPGQLAYLISDLTEEESCENRMIPCEFDIARLNCGHKCFSGSHCHICPNTIRTANAVFNNYKNF